MRLTKEIHLCHVFAVTSDSLFIERVFNVAMLHGRRRYIRIDDFDHETTAAFLVGGNILFVDPLRKGIRPQSQLDLLAIREVLKLLAD